MIFPKSKKHKVVVWLNGKATKEPGRLRSPSSKHREDLKFRYCSSLVVLSKTARRTSQASHVPRKTVTLSGVQRGGGEWGAGPGHPIPAGHSKSEITKIEML